MKNKVRITAFILILSIISAIPVYAIDESFYSYISDNSVDSIDEYIKSHSDELQGLDTETYNKIANHEKVWQLIRSDKSLGEDNIIEIFNDTVSSLLITVKHTPDLWMYYYRLAYDNVPKKLTVNTNSMFSCYSTYGLLSYCIDNPTAVADVDFLIYCENFNYNRNGGMLYAEIFDAIPNIASGEYSSDSSEYVQWKGYFANRKNTAVKLWEYRATSYPDVVFDDVYDSNGDIQSYKTYNGTLKRSSPEMTQLLCQSGKSQSVISVSSSVGENMRPNFYMSELGITYDLTRLSGISEEILNSASSPSNIKRCIQLFGDELSIDYGVLPDISGVCSALYSRLAAGTVFDKQSFKAAYDEECRKYLNIPQIINAFKDFHGTADEFTEKVEFYKSDAGIDDKYINDFKQLADENKSRAINYFCINIQECTDFNKLFLRALINAYDEYGEYEDAVRYSNDFDSEWKFIKYFLNQLDMNGRTDLAGVKQLYQNGEYQEALKLYRDIVLNNMRMTDLGELAYHGNCYNLRSWGDFFAGVTSSFNTSSEDLMTLYKCNFQGNPYSDIKVDWSYSVKFPEQAQMSDISYFTCFNPIAVKYYLSGNKLYLDKWMQIANAFCTEHKRWFAENYSDTPKLTNCCWNSSNAQSVLNQAGRIQNIIRCLGIFAKLADGDKPASWDDILEARDSVSDRSKFDNIDPIMFANITISLIYDHSEAEIQAYVPYGAIPNQRLSGLKSLAYIDRFFGDTVKYANEYSEKVNEGLTSYESNSFYPDGGMIEQAFNYNIGDIKSISELGALYENYTNKPLYIEGLNNSSLLNRKMMSAISFPNGAAPAVGMGGASINPFANPGFTSVAFPYIGFYMMRSSWDMNGNNLFIQAPRRTRGHLYPSSNGIELYGKGRLLLMNGGSPWYAKSMAPDDQVEEYGQYNAYFGENSSLNRNTVIVNGGSQSKSEFDGAVGSPEVFDYPLNKLWHSSDSFDYLSSDYDGGYGNSKAGIVHNRQVVYIKSLDLYVLADTVSGCSKKTECSQLWNFMPYLTNENDGTEVNGFSEDEVCFNSENKYIKTTDQDDSNVFLYNFYPEALNYTKYYGYKGDDGYRGFYASGYGSRYPKVDMSVNWSECGKEIPVLTLIDTSESTQSKIISYTDLSFEDYDGGYSGFEVQTDCGKLSGYFSSCVRNYKAGNADIRAESIIYDESSGKAIVLGAEGYAYRNFECNINDNRIECMESINVPMDFSWQENSPMYEYSEALPSVSNAKITGNSNYGGTLLLEYDFNGENDESLIQWYLSDDGYNWELIVGECGTKHHIKNYSKKSIGKYYMAAIKPKSGSLTGKIVYTSPTSYCCNSFDDFEGDALGEIYNASSLKDEANDFSTTVSLKTENNNTFSHIVYQNYDETGEKGTGYDIYKSAPYFRRFWQSDGGLSVLQVRIRMGGDNASISIPYIKELIKFGTDGAVSSSCLDENGATKWSRLDNTLLSDKWYTIKCVVNSHDYEIESMPPMSYIYAVENEEDEWIQSDLLQLPQNNKTSVDTDLSVNESRMMISMGSKSAAKYSYVDIDDYGILPTISIKDIRKSTSFGIDSDTASYDIDVINNDATSKRSRTIIVCAYENDRLTEVKVVNVNLEPNEKKTVNTELTLPKQQTDRQVKCMILNDNKALMPVYNSLTYTDYLW